MGVIRAPQKVKLFCGIIFSNERVKQATFSLLEKEFGEIAAISDTIFFNFSNYYNAEMGNGLRRLWVSFIKLIFTSTIVKIKKITNSLENEFSINHRRQINIDPGYITPANVILVTTKNYCHRIHLSDGIYGEVTTIYKKNSFIKLPWSYPDYLSETAVEFFLKSRVNLLKQLKTH
ncbi:MAG: DUF4416 family protein [Endomicrobium sp.]|jgi:hypothetical protein|nr:DUF4416 family protein [Endomicrobium sp.]